MSQDFKDVFGEVRDLPHHAVDVEFGTDFRGSEDVTVQSFKDQVDINKIVARFGLIGDVAPPRAVGPENFGDFTGAVDYREAVTRVVEAQQSFNQLPAELRAKFDNDPAKFLEFVHESDNVEEAVKLGILAKTALPEPVVVESAVTSGEGTPSS